MQLRRPWVRSLSGANSFFLVWFSLPKWSVIFSLSLTNRAASFAKMHQGVKLDRPFTIAGTTIWRPSPTAGAAPTEFGSIVREPKAEVVAAWRIRDVIIDANAMLVFPRWIVVIMKFATTLPDLSRYHTVQTTRINYRYYKEGRIFVCLLLECEDVWVLFQKSATWCIHSLKFWAQFWDHQEASLAWMTK